MRPLSVKRRALLLCIGLCLAPILARAQTENADALVRRGVELRRAGQDEQALASFESALRIEATPRVRAQIGFAQQALGRWVAAERSLMEASTAQDDPWIRRHRAQIQSALQEVRRHLGSLTVTTNAPSAQLVVDGFVIGTLPMTAPLRLPTGPTTLTVRADGFVPMSRSVVIEVDATSRESFDLAPEVAAPSARVEAPSLQPVPPQETTRGRRARTLRTVGWIAGGLSAASVIAGGVMVGVYNDTATQWNDISCVRDGRTRGENCRDLLDTALLQHGVATGLFVTAGVLAVSAGVLFGLAAASPTREARVACAPMLGSPGLVCGGAM